MFRRGMQNLLVEEIPNCTFSVAARYFVQSYGGARSAAELLRKYPWAKQIFDEEKRIKAEYREQVRAFRARRAT